MSRDLWADVDSYFSDLLVPSDPALESALRESADAGLPPINVSPLQGRFLHLLARMQGARSILEIGTLGGYSTIWLGRALPDGARLVTLEMSSRHAEVARVNIERAGLGKLVEIRLGQALETLPRLAAEGGPPFDLVFIDADKTNCAEYFDWSLKLTRPGALIIVDNVVRSGAVVDATSESPDVQGVRRFNERLAAEPRVTATALQMVGVKGYDGMALALVNA